MASIPRFGGFVVEALMALGVRYVDGWWTFFAGVWAWAWLSNDVEVPTTMASIAAVSSALAVVLLWGLGMPFTSLIAGMCTLFSMLTLAKHQLFFLLANDDGRSNDLFRSSSRSSTLLSSPSSSNQVVDLIGASSSSSPSATAAAADGGADAGAAVVDPRVVVGGSAGDDATSAAFLLRRLTVCQAAVLAVVILCQLLTARQALEEYWKRGSAPPGKMVDIGGGRWLHMKCVGSGPRVVVLESGLPYSSVVWQPLMELFEKRLRESKLAAAADGGRGGRRDVLSQLTLCAYDRAGYGWSPRAWGRFRRAGSAMREDLDGLISAQGFDHPVLMGWSYGGQLAASYACERPGKISGLVLVDAAAPYGYFQIPNFRETWWTGVIAFAIGQILQPLGLFRNLWRLGILPAEAGAPPPGLSPTIASQIVAQMGAYEFPSVALAELIGMRQTDEDVVTCFGCPQKWLPTPLGDVPTLVLYAEDNPQAPSCPKHPQSSSSSSCSCFSCCCGLRWYRESWGCGEAQDDDLTSFPVATASLTTAAAAASGKLSSRREEEVERCPSPFTCGKERSVVDKGLPLLFDSKDNEEETRDSNDPRSVEEVAMLLIRRDPDPETAAAAAAALSLVDNDALCVADKLLVNDGERSVEPRHACGGVGVGVYSTENDHPDVASLLCGHQSLLLGNRSDECSRCSGCGAAVLAVGEEEKGEDRKSGSSGRGSGSSGRGSGSCGRAAAASIVAVYHDDDRNTNTVKWEWPQISNRTIYCSAGKDTDHYFPVSQPDVILDALAKLLKSFSSNV